MCAAHDCGIERIQIHSAYFSSMDQITAFAECWITVLGSASLINETIRADSNYTTAIARCVAPSMSKSRVHKAAARMMPADNADSYCCYHNADEFESAFLGAGVCQPVKPRRVVKDKSIVKFGDDPAAHQRRVEAFEAFRAEEGIGSLWGFGCYHDDD
jgi:hypothetical protein